MYTFQLQDGLDNRRQDIVNMDSIFHALYI
jgi:hypothetical protein